MNEKKKREDFSKVGVKTKPTSIRFNEEQLEVALERTGKKSKQQLVDFILDEFVRPSNPITERMEDFNDFAKKAQSAPKINPASSKTVTVPIKPKTEPPGFKSDMEREIWEDEQRILNSKNK
jgi:hypothetical protein